jgi:hypothetical protein
LADYATILRYRDLDTDTFANVTAALTTAFSGTTATSWKIRDKKFRIPFTAAISEGLPDTAAPLARDSSYRNYSFATKISAWADGTTNQLILGEKHIPSTQLKNEGGGNPFTGGKWDGSYLFISQNSMNHVFRIIHAHNDGSAGDEFGLVQKKEDTTSNAGWGFGSHHNGVVNFCIGDSSVRGIAITVNPTILAYLADINDGHSATLP